METRFGWITCDGCGHLASPEHIAERIVRLEHATRYRPVHVNVLYVARAPHAQDDFYDPSQSSISFNSLMKATGIDVVAETSVPNSESQPQGNGAGKLDEFQHRGYYLAYLSECPIQGSDHGNLSDSILGQNLIRRIQFNYRPKKIALLGKSMAPVIEILEKAEMGNMLFLDAGQPLSFLESSGSPG